MLKNSNITPKRALSLLIKVLIVSVSFGFLYYKIVHTKDLDDIQHYFKQLFDSDQSLVPLIAAILLMPLNWGLETAKWRMLVRKIEVIGLFKAFRAVFSGVTVSLLAPNRSGEFAGRILYLNRSDRIQGILITILGSISQMMITLIVGGISLVAFTMKFTKNADFPYAPQLTAFLVFIVIFIVILAYLNTNVLTILLKKFRFPERFHRYIEVFTYYSSLELIRVLLYSLVRYAVFAFQFYLLLRFARVDISAVDALILIPMTFLAMTAVPTIALTEIVVRESVALSFIGLVATNDLGIATAAFALWGINLGLPSFLGGLFLFGVRIFRIKRKP